ncbi:MAG: FAD binding domain-containing protein, partial [Gemmatimonadota bacterium]|nr:FAD binding domain-containing protein [Gemmatimonadota bacterium]
MKAFTNQNPRTLDEAVSLAREALQAGQSVSFAGGGTDLLQLMKDRLVNRPGSGQPDVLVNLKTVDGLDEISSTAQGGMTIGGLTTLDTLTEHPV